LVEVREGEEGNVSPKVAAAKLAGVGRKSLGDGGGNLGIASELEGRERSVRGLGWVGQPTRTRAGSA
jgi:hypothetical protein